MWNWHGKEYIGAVHGVGKFFYKIIAYFNLIYCTLTMGTKAGIAAILLQFRNLAEPYLDDLFQTMEWLAKVAFENGNYPSSLQSNGDDLVQ